MLVEQRRRRIDLAESWWLDGQQLDGHHESARRSGLWPSATPDAKATPHAAAAPDTKAASDAPATPDSSAAPDTASVVAAHLTASGYAQVGGRRVVYVTRTPCRCNELLR